MTQTLSQLEHSGAFIERHIGSSAQQQQQLLEAVGARSLSALIQQIVPADIQLPGRRRWAMRRLNIRRWPN
ncbi:Glycine dehydrogenase [decarboxylating] [Serratia plymuthica]|uniref:Glycine dehydrogenase [decarboxylating] n=1 Tax=Serratia plymuthica TaxID=82996 RepID=A0A2X4UYI9_SERPL|nr:Glycine dehydrogenase [decarboxylating] [Serratia plymuthica]